MTSTHDEISKRAREIWESEGRPEGRDKEHWLQAESELQQGSIPDQSDSNVPTGEPSILEAATAARENGARKRSGRRLR